MYFYSLSIKKYITIYVYKIRYWSNCDKIIYQNFQQQRQEDQGNKTNASIYVLFDSKS